jgi:hypothetical protein
LVYRWGNVMPFWSATVRSLVTGPKLHLKLLTTLLCLVSGVQSNGLYAELLPHHVTKPESLCLQNGEIWQSVYIMWIWYGNYTSFTIRLIYSVGVGLYFDSVVCHIASQSFKRAKSLDLGRLLLISSQTITNNTHPCEVFTASVMCIISRNPMFPKFLSISVDIVEAKDAISYMLGVFHVAKELSLRSSA